MLHLSNTPESESDAHERAKMARRRAIHWNVLVIPCAEHHGHKVIVAGLDQCADDTAAAALAAWKEHYPASRLVTKLLAVDEAEVILGTRARDDDEDLPF